MLSLPTTSATAFLARGDGHCSMTTQHVFHGTVALVGQQRQRPSLLTAGSIRAFVERRCACCAVREVRDGLKAHAYVSFKPRALTCTVDAWLLVRGLFS